LGDDALNEIFREARTHGVRNLFAENPQLVEETAKRNSTLQGAYLIIAARALGLDCGPMSGFDNAKVDEEFFGAGEECEGCEQEFFPQATSSRISYATLAMAMSRNFFPEGHGWHSTRPVRFYERTPFIGVENSRRQS
jgi:hypothetical protein